MAEKPLTTSPMYPGIEYVRVRQGGSEFTTSKTSVTDDMEVLKDADAISRISGQPLEPVSVGSSDLSDMKVDELRDLARTSDIDLGGARSKADIVAAIEDAQSSTTTSGGPAASTQSEEG